MSNPSATVRTVEDTLQSIIVSLIDAQKGFLKLGDTMSDERLKKYFLAESLTRASYRGDLETVLHQEGIHDISESGSAGGAVSRIWTSIQAALHESDHALLATAESAEAETVQTYTEALDKGLPSPVRQLLNSQLSHLQASLAYIRAAREARA